jgi:hypothetical protein
MLNLNKVTVQSRTLFTKSCFSFIDILLRCKIRAFYRKVLPDAGYNHDAVRYTLHAFR